MALTLQSIISSIKGFFSKPRNAAAGGAAAGFAVGALSSAAITHGITRAVVRNQMSSIKSTADFKHLNEDFKHALMHVTRTNERAQAICKRALEDSPLFREAGQVGQEDARFHNATTDARFIELYNRMLTVVDGRADRMVLRAISLLKNEILEGVMTYLCRKGFFVENEGYTWRDFSRRLTKNPEYQMDRGSASMVVFLNVFLSLYEYLFESISNGAHMYQVNQADSRSEDIATLFGDMMIGFVINIRSTMLAGDSDFLNWFRGVFGIISVRGRVLDDLIKRVDQSQGEMIALVQRHARNERVFSLPEGLIWFGEISKGYLLRFACVLMQKYCSTMQEDDDYDVDAEGLNSPLIKLLAIAGDNIFSSSLSVPLSIKLKKIGKLKNKRGGVSDRAIERAAGLLHEMALWQSLSNELSAAIQVLATLKGEDSLSTVMMSLLASLLACSHKGMIKALKTLLDQERGTYYSLWFRRHRRVFQWDGTMRRTAKQRSIFLRGKDGRGSLLFIQDEELLDLWAIAHKLEVSYAQFYIRSFLGSIQYQRDLLRELVHLREEHRLRLDENDREVSQLYYNHVDESCRNVLDFCGFLLVNQTSRFASEFENIWNAHWADRRHVPEETPGGVSEIQMLYSCSTARDAALEALKDLLQDVWELTKNILLSGCNANLLIAAVKARNMRYVHVRIEQQSTGSRLVVRIKGFLVRVYSHVKAMKSELEGFLSWLSKEKINGDACFASLVDLAKKASSLSLVSPTHAVSRRVERRHEELALLVGDGEEEAEAELGNPFGNSDEEQSDSDMSDEEEYVAGGGVVNPEEEAKLGEPPEAAPIVPQRQAPRDFVDRQALARRFPLSNGLPIVRSPQALERRLSRLIFWNRQRKADKMEAVLFSVKGAAVTINDKSRSLSDAIILRLLLTAVDVCACHRWDRSSRAKQVGPTRSIREFVSGLLERKNAAYLNELLNGAERLKRGMEQKGGERHQSVLKLEYAILTVYYTAQFSERFDNLKRVHNEVGLNHEDSADVMQTCRFLMTFRILYHLKKQIDGKIYHTPMSLANIVNTFFFANHPERGALVNSQEMAELTERGRGYRQLDV